MEGFCLPKFQHWESSMDLRRTRHVVEGVADVDGRGCGRAGGAGDLGTGTDDVRERRGREWGMRRAGPGSRRQGQRS